MSQTFGAWRATYTPGSWVVLAGPSSLVVMQPAAPRHSGLVASIWQQVAEADDPQALVSTLTMIGLAKMPSLGVFFWVDGEMYSMARGQVVVKDASTGEVVNHGDGLLTWSEKKLNPSTVVVEMEEVEQRLAMPLLLGVAQASKVIIDATGQVQPFVVGGGIHRPRVVASSDDALKPWVPQEQQAEEEAGELTHPADEWDAPGFVEVPAPDSAAIDSAEAAPEQPVSPVAVQAAEPESVETAVAGEETEPVRAQNDGLGDAGAFDGQFYTGTQPVGVQPEPGDVVSALAPGTSPQQPSQFQYSADESEDEGFASASVSDGPFPPSNVAATLVSTTGEVTYLKDVVLVGRAPRAENGEDIMRVPSPRQDISRTHVKFAVGQWGIEVTDMHSTNGTVVRRVGQDPLRLESGQTIELAIGDAVDLGDGVVITIEAYQG
ncbi:FHA domain-containing protein [Cutibacterium sp.]|uniref:FHA domain-containing protein n=1 Tax=Cutibacterium sp. TaxID=1912221 RepID=UPI0026DAB03B|nr:FHA domain-containing protein [Cutibacterium sp.]MDO4412281.1 FHA domain-containing protein [Cutibacterium sp.]